MVAELNVLNEWIPEQMQPGTIFVLENAGHVGEKEDPYWAVLSCPDCGTLGLITRKQLAGLLTPDAGCSYPSPLAQTHLIQLLYRFPIPRRRADLKHLLQNVIGQLGPVVTIRTIEINCLARTAEPIRSGCHCIQDF